MKKIKIPYRVNLLGSYADCHNGKVAGFAINKYLKLYYKEQKDYIYLYSFSFPDKPVIWLCKNIVQKENDWADYCRGIFKYVKEKYTINKGFSGYIYGELPPGGISSSSALSLAFLEILCKLNNIKLTVCEKINLVYQVENNFVGVKSGKMDPACQLLSKNNNILIYDCASDNYQYQKLPKNKKLLLCYTGESHQLIKSSFNKYEELQKNIFKKLGVKDLNSLMDVVNILENAQNILDENEYKMFNYLVKDQNYILSKNIVGMVKNDTINFINSFNNISEKSKFLIDSLYAIKGVDAVKLCGAGIRGFCIAIVDKKELKNIKNKISIEYKKAYPTLKSEFICVEVKTISCK